jgi:hypothetical protein
VNAHLNAVHTSLKKFEANVNGFFNCLDAFPVTQYSTFMSGDGITPRTGLDVTASGDAIDGWFLDIDGGTCGLPGVAAVAGRSHSSTPRSLSFRSVFRR